MNAAQQQAEDWTNTIESTETTVSATGKIVLTQTIWEIGRKANNPSDFAIGIDESDLGMFGFTDDFVFDLWGAISDAKSGRLNQVSADFSEQF